MLPAKDAIEHHVECMIDKEAEIWANAMEAYVHCNQSAGDPESNDCAQYDLAAALNRIAQLAGILTPVVERLGMRVPR